MKAVKLTRLLNVLMTMTSVNYSTRFVRTVNVHGLPFKVQTQQSHMRVVRVPYEAVIAHQVGPTDSTGSYWGTGPNDINQRLRSHGLRVQYTWKVSTTATCYNLELHGEVNDPWTGNIW